MTAFRDTSPTVALVCAHAYPDPAVGARRLSELSIALCDRGYDVHVFAKAGPFERPGEALPGSICEHRIPFPRAASIKIKAAVVRYTNALRSTKVETFDTPGGASPVVTRKSKLVTWLLNHYFRITLAVDNHKAWSITLARSLLSFIHERRPALVVVSGPTFSTVAATAFVCRFSHTKLVVDFRDPWPRGNLKTPERVASLTAYINGALERFCVEHASAITTSSRRLAERLQARYPKASDRIHTIRNGFEESMKMLPPAPRNGLSLLYAGTIYLNRNPMPLLQSILELKGKGVLSSVNFEFRIVGNCKSWEGVDIPLWIASRQLDDLVRIIPPVGPRDIPDFIRQANVLVNFAQGQMDQVPAKLFEQLASYRKILLFSEPESETSMTCGDAPQVFRVDSDVASISATLERLLRDQQRDIQDPDETTYPLEHFSRKYTNAKFEELFQSIIQ